MNNSQPVIAYNAPIALCHDYIPTYRPLTSISGQNNGAKYDSVTQVFKIQDVIIVTIGERRYQAYEYHFHFPGFHKICGKRYDAELHYSLAELGPEEEYINTDLPNDAIAGDRNILAVAWPIKGSKSVSPVNLATLKLLIPSAYFSYNATRPMAGNPVLWIVAGKRYMKFDLEQLLPFAQTTPFPIQPRNGRIVLFREC
jgi:carbonic anhydrase